MPSVMNRRRGPSTAIWVLVAAAGSAVGCGGADGAASNVDVTKPFAAGDDASRPLRDLSAADLGRVCAAGAQYLVAQERANRATECRSTAFNTVRGLMMRPQVPTDAELQARCQTTYDACLYGVHGSPGRCGTPAAACASTVADVEACVNDETIYVVHLGDGLPECSKVTAALAASIVLPPISTDQFASCLLLNEKCPGLRFLEL
jgi:hypothetical protein